MFCTAFVSLGLFDNYLANESKEGGGGGGVAGGADQINTDNREQVNSKAWNVPLYSSDVLITLHHHKKPYSCSWGRSLRDISLAK